MHRIMFVCHGNICRSPMAEFVMKDLATSQGLGDRFQIASRATSTEEIGNPVHPGTRKALQKRGITCNGKHAAQLKASDYDQYDLFIGMDAHNLKNMLRIFGGDPENKVRLLLNRDVADPWYTGDFETTYRDVLSGCQQLMQMLTD